MKSYVTSSLLLSVLLGASAAGAASVAFPNGLKNLTSADAYHMRTVRVVQARVQSDKPAWNEANSMFVSKFYTDFSTAFRGVLDTVNTASVEGALMYVQAEGINYATRGTTPKEWCTRKNNMNYVVFYDMVITQTNETLALYNAEYGKYLAMDGGQCTPTSGAGPTAVYPTECYYFNGTDGQPNVGPFVGGEARETDPRASYPNTWWYSFPNTCPLQAWANKTDECRASTRGGLCPYDTKPDGSQCTFNYRILGWVPIDDLVGITAMPNANTSKPYTNFTEFCQAGNVEFNATTSGTWLNSIPFWENPQNESANVARAQTLVDVYTRALAGNSSFTQVTSADLAHFKALPTIAELRTANPPCYANVAECATATNGCKRDLYGQICTVCSAAADDCVVAPSGFTFPALVKATAAPSATPPPGSSGSSGPSAGSSGTPRTPGTPGNAGSVTVTSSPSTPAKQSAAAPLVSTMQLTGTSFVVMLAYFLA